MNSIRGVACCLVFVGILVAWPDPAIGGPGGELDPTFGDSGRVVFEFPGQDDLYWGVGSAVVEQPGDGKLLVAGYAHQTWREELDNWSGVVLVVARFHPDGSLDTSFGVDGIARVEFPGFDARPIGIARLPDGKLILAGNLSGYEIGENREIVVVRLLSNGASDPAYGFAGSVRYPFAGQISDLALLPSGKLLLTGSTTTGTRQSLVLMRIATDGALDSSFGQQGVQTVTLASGDASAAAISVQPDGRIVVCGSAGGLAVAPYASSLLAVRFLADGVLDAGFGAGGIFRQAVDGSAVSVARGCQSYADGSVLLAGYTGRFGDGEPLLARVTTNGSLDPAFGSEGLARVGARASGSFESAILQAEGRIAALGLTSVLVTRWYPSEWPYYAIQAPPENVGSEILVARFDSQGALDDSFGDHGMTLVDFGEQGSPSLAWGVELLPDRGSKLLAVGTSVQVSQLSNFQNESPRFALARIDPAGTGFSGTAGFVRTVQNVTEDAGDAVLTLRRLGGSTGSLSVDFTAVADSGGLPQQASIHDFVPAQGTVVWGDGDLGLKTFLVPIVRDSEGESYEYFDVVLSNSTGGLAASSLRVWIHDVPARSVADVASGQTPPPEPSLIQSGGGSFGVDLLLLAAVGATMLYGCGNSVFRPRSRRALRRTATGTAGFARCRAELR